MAFPPFKYLTHCPSSRVSELNEFTFQSTLSEGRYGIAILLGPKTTDGLGMNPKIKFVAKIQRSDNTLDKLNSTSEINNTNLLMSEENENIVRSTHYFLNNRGFGLITEQQECTLRSILSKGCIFPMKSAMKIWENICSALGYIHSKDRLHLNVCGGTIYLSFTGEFKLGGFRCVDKIGNSSINNPGAEGHRHYDVLKGVDLYQHVDFWALGVVVAQSMTGIPPFVDINVLEGSKPFLGEDISFLTQEARNFIEMSLGDVEKRDYADLVPADPDSEEETEEKSEEGLGASEIKTNEPREKNKEGIMDLRVNKSLIKTTSNEDARNQKSMSDPKPTRDEARAIKTKWEKTSSRDEALVKTTTTSPRAKNEATNNSITENRGHRVCGNETRDKAKSLKTTGGMLKTNNDPSESYSEAPIEKKIKTNSAAQIDKIKSGDKKPTRISKPTPKSTPKRNKVGNVLDSHQESKRKSEKKPQGNSAQKQASARVDEHFDIMQFAVDQILI